MDIVIIGNGIAGNSAASAIREFDQRAGITMISEERQPLYSPGAFHKFFSGEIERHKLFLKKLNDYAEQGVRTVFGRRVSEIDIKNRKTVRVVQGIPELGCKSYGDDPIEMAMIWRAENAKVLHVVDFDSSAKVSGNGFYYLKNELALLNQALIRFAIDFMKSKGYEYIETPLMLNTKSIYASMDKEAIEDSASKGNWQLITGVIGGGVLLVAIVLFIVRRRFRGISDNSV